MIELTLPYPPSVNHYYRTWQGRTLISREGREYRKRVEGVMLEQKHEPLSGTLAVRVDVCPPDRRRRDLDNVLKALLDALQHGGAYEDDNQLWEVEEAIPRIARLRYVDILMDLWQRANPYIAVDRWHIRHAPAWLCCVAWLRAVT